MILLDITVEREIKSLNKFLNTGYGKQNRGHFINAQYKKKWYEWVRVYAGRCPHQIDIPVTGKYIRLIGYKQHDLDKENLYSGSKPIRDILKKLGWLHDDNPRWHPYECTQVKANDGKAGTRIILEVPE